MGDQKVANCPGEVVRGQISKWNNALVGHLLGKRPTFHYTKEVLLKMWRISGNVEINLPESGVFVFRFNLQEDRDKVLEGGLWYVQRRPLFSALGVKRYPWGKSLLSSIPVWVTLPYLPSQFWTLEALSAIGSVIGHPISLDVRTKTLERLSYARLCVEVNASEQLPSTVAIKDEEGRIFKQEIMYDWKLTKCSACKVFGHSLEQYGETPVAKHNRKTKPVWRKKDDGVEPTLPAEKEEPSLHKSGVLSKAADSTFTQNSISNLNFENRGVDEEEFFCWQL
ncbi:uncharacterized protein LOC122066273 [Macadamia integrifolia]|uniref:uncharacterized protein LOC122066273 n=1 Tax=Macadamia integrifolia TaxID=60698 RepID=UPI001C4FDC72|nr:uncharacterized protein LOC122066273 [Macadamia integrifolia]